MAIERKLSDGETPLAEDLSRFAKSSQARHSARERAKALDGREEDVQRRQERAEKDNGSSH